VLGPWTGYFFEVFHENEFLSSLIRLCAPHSMRHRGGKLWNHSYYCFCFLRHFNLYVRYIATKSLYCPYLPKAPLSISSHIFSSICMTDFVTSYSVFLLDIFRLVSIQNISSIHKTCSHYLLLLFVNLSSKMYIFKIITFVWNSKGKGKVFPSTGLGGP
jgi:hypothetical protein